MSSALENELRAKLFEWKIAISKHDRVVLMGFSFTLLPILPLSLFGLILCLFNQWLFLNGKLPFNEKALLQKGIIFGIINTALGALLFYVIAEIVLQFNWSKLIFNIFEFLSYGLNYIRAFTSFRVFNGGLSV